MSGTDPHVRMAEMRPLEQSITDAPARVVGALAMQLVLDDVVNHRLEFVVVLTFRGAAGRVWQLRDIAVGEGVDDLVRTIARSEQAEAVVVVRAISMPPGVEGDRCVEIAAECDGTKFDHLVVFKSGPEGEMSRVCGRSYDDQPRPKFRWLGVPPIGKVDLRLEGIVGMMPLGGRGGGSA